MKGFDCNCKLSYAKAKEFKNKGYEFVFRYVGRMQMADNDLDRAETENILKAGLQLGVVQHVEKPSWLVSKEKGKAYGENAVKFAHQCGVEPTTALALDLEGLKAGQKKQDIIDFCNAWYDAVVCDYDPVLYVGYDTFLTGNDLYYSLKFKHYWRSGSITPDVTNRGYCMVQGMEITECGILIDPDELKPDKLLDTLTLMQSYFK